MSGWGGILAGAMAGGARAGEEIADSRIQQRNRESLMQLDAQLDAQRAEQIARIRQRIGREDAQYETTGPGGQAKIEYEANRARTLGPIEQQQAIEREQGILAARGEAARKNQAAMAKDPEALAGVRAEARARHIESAASGESAAATREERTRRANLEKMIDEYATTEDPQRRAALERQLVARGVLKPSNSEYDTEKVTEEKMNPDGTTTKVERTQRRKPDNAPKQEQTQTKTAAPSPGTVVDGYTFLGGDPKDPKNWKLPGQKDAKGAAPATSDRTY